MHACLPANLLRSKRRQDTDACAASAPHKPTREHEAAPSPTLQVRFYDSVLRLSAWFEELRAGPVAAVSFSTAGQQKVEAANKLNR